MKARYDRLGPSRFPWSTEHPLVFHQVTSLGWGDEAAWQALHELLALGAHLQPYRSRSTGSSPWGDEQRHLGGIDADAGDDRALFFSPLRPYKGAVLDRGSNKPVVAFDAFWLLLNHEVGWRPHDLIGAYNQISFHDPFTFTDLHHATPRLREVAACYTVTARETVARLIDGEALHLMGEPHGLDDLLGTLEEDATRACRHALAPVEKEYRPSFRVPFRPLRELGRFDTFPGTLLRGHNIPELLVYSEVPLRRAIFVCDPVTGIWHEVRDGKIDEEASP
jgi:hypothetical protein